MSSNKFHSNRAYPTYPIVAVGAVVIHADCVLLVKRSQPPSKDAWALPGGKVELGETLQQAAEREIWEETGIIIKARDPVYTFDVIEYDAEKRLRFHYVIVDLAAQYISGTPVASDDAAGARWVFAAELANLPVNAATLYLLKEKFGFSP